MHLVEPDDTTFGTILTDVVEELSSDTAIARRAGTLLDEVAEELRESGIAPGAVLLQALARMPQSLMAAPHEFERRRNLTFEVNERLSVRRLSYVANGSGRFVVRPADALVVVQQANATLLTLEQFTRSLRVPLSQLMGMRGMSVLVSAVMVSEIEAVLAESVFSNPHQDGYPDLLPRTAECLHYAAEVRKAGRWSDKAAWTNPAFGGIEVKATNGNTPPARIAPKPALGEERSRLIRSYDWKAHHQETQRLWGNVWDFVDSVATVTACFWRNDLTTSDWGGVVTPKAGGGRTTSVSIMNSTGLAKMAEGWLVRTTDPSLRDALHRGRMLAYWR